MVHPVLALDGGARQFLARDGGGRGLAGRSLPVSARLAAAAALRVSPGTPLDRAGLGGGALPRLLPRPRHAISTGLLSFAAPEIRDVYSTRAQAAPWVIAPLLFFWVGPAEEIFWRGLVQDRLAAHLGDSVGYLSASLVYAGVHIWAFNLMLFTAALVCGLFWGFLFLKSRSLWPGVISHAVWDVAIFIFFPLQ